MKKTFLLLLAALLMGSTTAVKAKIVYVPLYIVDTGSDVKEPKRGPGVPLFITQDGYKLILPELDDSLTFRAFKGNTCVYEIPCQHPQPPVCLPASFIGDYEVRLCADNYYYHGYVSLELQDKPEIPSETDNWHSIISLESGSSEEELLNALMKLNVILFKRKADSYDQSYITMPIDEVATAIPYVTNQPGFMEGGVVNLYSIISVLVGCIQELKFELDSRTEALVDLSEVLSDIMSQSSSSTTISSVRAAIGSMLLSPATTTVGEPAQVRYVLSEDVANAHIAVTDMGGRLVTRVPVSPSDTSVSIDSGILDEGIFLCTLYADGKTIGTRRLVKTK